MAQNLNDNPYPCYGTKIDCSDRETCELGEPCLSLAKEPSEDRHYQAKYISLPDVFYNPNAEEDAEESPGKDEEEGTSAFADNAADTLHLDGITLNEDTLPVVLQVLEKIAEWYFYTPHTFNALMNKIFKGKTQSDIARERHVTRQCVNKRLLNEIGIAQKRNDIQERRDKELAEAKASLAEAESAARNHAAVMKDMTEAERIIYKICAEDGCLSVSSVAKQTGYSRKHIYATLHILREKYGIQVTLSTYSRKKTRKIQLFKPCRKSRKKSPSTS